MKKRRLLIGIIFSFFLSWGLFRPAAVHSGRADKRWNILLITIDTLRADRLSCYGYNHVRTAHLDRLAAQGTLFTRAFAHTPTTLPSHANILLGTTPLHHGVHENSNFVVREEMWTLAEHLRREGYATAAFVGAYPLDSRFGLDQGFDTYDDDYGSQSARGAAFYVERKAEEVIARASSWLNGRASPWFLWVHCFDPHEPYDPPPPFDSRFKESLYDGEVAYVDSAIGRLLSDLQAGGLFERTLIILTGDHGESLGEHGEATHAYFAYNATLRVPLIICIPGAGSSRADDYVSHIDIFPTVCDALGIRPPPGLPGTSLLPATKGKKLPARPIYFESLYPYYSRGWAPLRGIIQDQRKYIDSPVPELYDLAEDFNELRNLAGRLNLDRYRKSLKNVMDEQSAAGESDSRRPADSETLRKLRSLGYISGQGALKETFGPKDDVKALLPYHNRSMEARALFREGKADAAVDMLKAVIAERDDIDVAYSNLATLYKERGQLEEAIQVLKDGLSNLPSNYTIFSTYVNFLVAAGRFTEILEAVSKTSIRQMDYDPEIWNHLGIAYANTGESEKALSAFEKSLALDDQFASTYVNRGTLFLSMFLRSGNSDMAQKAAADYTKAAALDPDSSAALNGLGVVSRLTGDPDSAIRYLRKALEAKPGYGDALYNLGMAYLDKKDYSRALEVFQDYRKKYGSVLPQADMKRLDDLIRECRRRI